MAGKMISVNIAKVIPGDVEELEPFQALDVGSRDLLAVEKTTRGFTTIEFVNNPTLVAIYMVAWRTMKRRKLIQDEMTLPEFEDAYEISLSSRDDPDTTNDPDEATAGDPTE